MNLYRLAVIALRVCGIDLIISGVLWLLYVPHVLLEMMFLRTDAYSVTHVEISLAAHLGHTAFEIVAGVGLIAWSRPWARSLTDLLVGGVDSAKAALDAWPPPPCQLAGTGQPPLLQEEAGAGVRRAAGLLLRADGVTWLIGIGTELIELPYDIYGLWFQHHGYWRAEHLLGVCVSVMRCLAKTGVGLYLLFSPEGLANRITLDLVHDAESEHETPVTLSEGVGESGTAIVP